MKDDEELFLNEMSDVARRKRSERVLLDRDKQATKDSSLLERRKAAVSDSKTDNNILTDEGIEPLDPWYVLNFKRPGIQNGVFRKLKQGRYEAEASLDLHRLTVKAARVELFDFVTQCSQLGLRTVMVIHGKGESPTERGGRSILKGCTNHWLIELPGVQAFHSAPVRHGGTGAVYILLRKSEEKKRENRERFKP
jgi:DNA-nicking Smr family endonuclease